MDKKITEKEVLREGIEEESKQVETLNNNITHNLESYKRVQELIQILHRSIETKETLESTQEGYKEKSVEFEEKKKVIYKEKEEGQVRLKEIETEVEDTTKEVTTLQNKITKLEEVLKSFDNKELTKGYETELLNLKALKEKLEKKEEQYNKQKKLLSEKEEEFSNTITRIEGINKNICNTRDKIKNEVDLIKETIRDLVKYSTEHINLEYVNLLISASEKKGILKEKLANYTKDVNVQNAIDVVVNTDTKVNIENTSMEEPKITKELLFELFKRSIEKDSSIEKDNRDTIFCDIESVTRINKKFKIIDVIFDAFKENPTLLGCQDILCYITLSKNADTYTKENTHYGTKSHYPAIYRVFSYILNGIKELNNITYKELVDRLNGILEDNRTPFKMGSSIESNPNYLYCEKNGAYKPLAINTNTLIAIPKELYNYDFLARVIKEFGYEVKCKCKKDGRLGYDR